MKIKTLSSTLIILILPLFFFGQIRVSEFIQSSKLASETDNALYFIDFWATWCGPCIHASNYLASLQGQYPDNFYVLSLSQESSEVVKRFMTKHETDLAMAIDYEGEVFNKYGVKSLPYGVLLNASGEKLWEGHPADFKDYHLRPFLRSNTQKSALNEVIKVQSYEKEVVVEETANFKKDFDILQLETTDITAQLEVIKKSDFIELNGSLKDILTYAFSIHKDQIKVAPDANLNYSMRFKEGTKSYNNIASSIVKRLKLRKQIFDVEGEAIVFNITEPRFWDTNQINWGPDTQRFLIGDSEIQADDVSLNQISYKLANILEMPVIINDKDLANELHDWNIHYKYFDLMVSSMKDNYGISVEKKTTPYPNYVITNRGKRR